MSTLSDRVKVLPRTVHADDRGCLIKAFSGAEVTSFPKQGEVYVVSINPGESRGKHLHRLAHEWFTVVAGDVRFSFADPASGDRFDLEISAFTPASISVPPGVGHELVNVGDSVAIVVAFADRFHDPDDVFSY